METDIHFTRILFHINNPLSPSNCILSLTFISDFEALVNEIFFFTAQLVDEKPTFVKSFYKYQFYFPTFWCFHLLLALLFMYRLTKYCVSV